MDRPPDEDPMLDADDVAEEVAPDADPDHPMDSDPDPDDAGGDDDPDVNGVAGSTAAAPADDSTARLAGHSDSIYSVAVHPLAPDIVATGAGDNTAAVYTLRSLDDPVRPLWRSPPLPESVTALAFSRPAGAFLLAADLDGHVHAFPCPSLDALTAAPPLPPTAFAPALRAREVDEIAWLAPAPSPGAPPDAFAVGASDGGVWVHAVDAAPESIAYHQAYYQHSAATHAGAWTPDGGLLASAAEDGSLAVYAPFGANPAQPVCVLTAQDARFAVDGGFTSLAINPAGTLLAAGGPGGQIRIVSLPSASGASGGSGGGRSASGSSGGGGQLVAALAAQPDAIEALAWAPGPLALLAAGSVDGSVAVFDAGARFAVRRILHGAHGAHAVVQLAFDGDGTPGGGRPAGGPRRPTSAGPAAGAATTLTSCGMDGVVRRWDLRGGGPAPLAASAAAAGAGAGAGADGTAGLRPLEEFRGHRGGGEGGGVLGFVRAADRLVTAGDDGLALVFDLF